MEDDPTGPAPEGSIEANLIGGVSTPASNADDNSTEGDALQSEETLASRPASDATSMPEGSTTANLDDTSAEPKKSLGINDYSESHNRYLVTLLTHATDNPIVLEDDTERDTEISTSLEVLAKDKLVQIENTRDLCRALLDQFTTVGRAKDVPRKRSFDSYCRSHKLDSKLDPQDYLKEQADWVREMLVAAEVVSSHLQERKKKLCRALNQSRE
jgi:hypothetical protein